VVIEQELPINQVTSVVVTGAMEYDLIARPADELMLI